MNIKWYTPLVVGFSVAGAFWLVAGCLMLASWHSAERADRARNAPVCAPSQVFSDTTCQITRAGLLTRFTSDEMDLTVAGRNITAPVLISGPLLDTSPAVAVDVTIYRGQVIHVSGQGLSVDTRAAPSTSSYDQRTFGFIFLAFGAAFGGYFGVKTFQARTDV